MVAERKKRVAMTKHLKRDVFMACMVRVRQGILPFGSFRAVAIGINPKMLETVVFSF